MTGLAEIMDKDIVTEYSLADAMETFTGREWDGDTGLYFYRARYYSPEMARFISEDPIGLAGGINMYAYVGNAPLIFIDPLGLAINWETYALAQLLPNPLRILIENAALLGLSPSDAITATIEGFTHGWESGYYECYGKCMFEPLIALLEKLSVEYMIHEGGFKRFAKVLGVVTWATISYKNYKCIQECKKCL